MLDKLTKAFSLLCQDFNALKGDVQRLEKVRPIVKHGKDGVSPDTNEIINAVLEKIPTPKDGVSPDIKDIAAEAAKLIPEPKPGRDAIAPTVRDVADVVLANIEKPKDGVSPDVNIVAQQAAKLIPKPKDGVSPTPEAVAEKIPPPAPGKPGKDGVSVTDVQLKNNDLFVFLDGVRKKAGRIELPKQKLAFNPNTGGGGRKSKPVLDNEYYEKQIVVREPSDLSGDLRSDVVYFLDGVIDFTNSGLNITVPVNGLNIAGHGFDISGLACTDDNYTLFTSPVGGSGNLVFSKVFYKVEGVNSRVFALESSDGFGAVEQNTVNYNDCSSLGYLSGYRQGLEENTGRFGGSPTLEFRGSWSGGYRVSTSIVRNLSASMTGAIFSAGTGLVFNNRFLTDINADLPLNAQLTDFSPSNFANPSSFLLSETIVSRNGVIDPTDVNINPNILASDLQSNWSKNEGVDNTHVGGRSTITTEQLTTILVIGDFVDLQGIYTPSILEHYDTPANGQLRHIGTSPRDYVIRVDVLVDGPPDNELALKIVKWDDSMSAFVDVSIQRRTVTNNVGGRDVAIFNDIGITQLDQNDYVKLQIANNTGVGNVTAELDGFMIVSER